MATTTKFNTPYNHKATEKSVCLTPSKTEQQFEFETNINNIVKQQVNSCLPPETRQAVYNIHLSGNEYESQLNAIQEVTNYFEELPVKAKEYFEYKPQKMLDFIQNDNNLDKALEIGIIDKKAYFARKEAKMKETIQNNNTSSQDASKVISVPSQTIIEAPAQ